jgi:DNA-binding transcriptional regulator YdaS (Cro superfamily)
MSRDGSGILVTSLGYTFTTKAVPVSVSVSPTSATVASGKTQQFTATVANSSNQSVTWSVTGGTIGPSGLFTAPTVTADRTVTVKATSVADTSKLASAVVTVKAPATVLSVSPTTLSFTGQQGGANPPAGTLSIANTGGAILTYSAATDVSWLAVAPASGTAPNTLQVTPSTLGLVPGSYTAHITVTSAGAGNSPVTVLVLLTIAGLPVQHSVDLSWNASSSTGVVSYSAYRSTTSGGPYSLVASAIQGLSYNDATVQARVTYFYVVTAFDDRAQESLYSAEAKAVVP